MQLTVPRLFHTVVLTLVVWAALCLPAQVANAADPIEITAIEYLLAPNSESFRTVAEPSFAPLWQTSDQPTLNMGYRPEGAWVRFHITNHAANEVKRLLLVDWSFTLIEARILNTARGEWSSAVHTGDSVAPHKRDVNSPIQVLPLSLPPGEAEVYLRLEATAPMLLPFRLLAPSELPKAERDNNLLMSAFFGAMLVMMLYNASLFIFTRDAAYLFYCAYVLSGAFYVASIFSFGPYFLWWDSPWLVSRATVLSVSLGFFGAALFERQFLELRRQGGWLLHLSHVVLGYWLCAALVSAFAPQAIGYVRIEHGGSLTCVAAIVIAVVCWRRGSISAGYFLVAWTGLVCATLGITLAMAGIIPMTNSIRSTQLAGFILEFLLLSVALAERINREKASRLQAQDALLLMQQQNTALLESSVASRTRQLEQANLELKRLSNTDSLTGLSNRRGFEEQVAAAIEQGRTTGVPVAFLMLDVDHFKHINDTFGHGIGDECLAAVGQTLSEYSRRETECAARIGGEEFATVFYSMPAVNAVAVAEQIRSAIAKLEIRLPDGNLSFTISIGVAAWIPTEQDSNLTYANAADEALYRAKANGRNQVCLSGG